MYFCHMKEIEQPICGLINQIFEIEKKTAENELENKIKRNIRRMKSYIEEMGYHFHNPIGEKYDLTRLDCEASVTGTKTTNLVVIEVIKPIIHYRQHGENNIVQRGVVLVEAK